MKKILIISYFYPPCNLTASQRVGGWANYLHEFGYYPIIVTRNWENKINSSEDVLLSSGSELIHVKNDNHEVYYLPYKSSIRDDIYTKYKTNKSVQKLSKFFTFKDLVLENYTNNAIPFSNMYEFSKSLIEKEKDIQLLLISGNPFIQFKFGFDLNKQFGIKWIADYRDDWNTSELESTFGKVKRFIAKLQTRSEKKWVGSAECITSVSKVYADKIGNFVNKKGYVILNGYDQIFENEKVCVSINEFHITYNGSLYPTQPIEPILNVIKKIIDDKNIKLKIIINFPGLAFDKSQKKRVELFMNGYDEFVRITERVSKEEVITIQKKSDLLLMVSHNGIKGIPSSKLYEYIGLSKSILFYPNDKDIVESTLNDCKLGMICNDESEIYVNIHRMIMAKQNNVLQEINKDNSRIKFYSRRTQTKFLAELLDKNN